MIGGMVDLSVFWLQMLGVAIAIGIAGRLRGGWRWNAGGIAQLLVIGLICAYGIFVGSADTCALTAGTLLTLVTAWPRVLMRRFQHHMSLLDAASMREEAQRLALFLWGRPGRFWRDLAAAVSAALEDEAPAGDALLRRYLHPAVPRQYREAARNAQYTLLVLDRAWDRILTEFEVYTPDDGSILPLGMAMSAHRAYLEVGNPAAARQVLERVDFLAVRQPIRGILLYQLAFRSLVGDVRGVEDLVSVLALPLYAAYPWKARALAISGRFAEAHAAIDEAIAAVPPDQQHLVKRLRDLEAALDTAPQLGGDPAVAAELRRADAIFAHAMRQEAVVAPQKPGWAVVGLVGAIALAFIPAHLFTILPQDRWLELADQILRGGQLSDAALHGEWWRLLTYQFLHADLFHVGLNLMVLWLFGMQAVELFGSWAFLTLFFLAGVLGGVAQLELAPGANTIGASGAVLGVFGAVIAGMARSKILPPNVRKDRVARLLTVAALQFALDQLFASQIAVFVHAAGMAAGGLIGWLAPVRQEG
ncbi:MAG: rhomboid family intrarane serine protease [Cyanobacteria bacterium RYN_339]|nr:rhomboid family intrarane serine protease [Cyanobacteria bacterium RYN_339]